MVRVNWLLSWSMVVSLIAASCQVNAPNTPIPATSPESMPAAKTETPGPDAGTPELTATPSLTPSTTPETPRALTWRALVEGKFFSGLTLSPSGRYLYFLGVISDESGLWRLDLSTSSEPVRMSDTFGAISLALSANGSEAVLFGDSMHVIDLETGDTLAEEAPANQYCVAAFISNSELARACTTIGEEPAVIVLDTYEGTSETKELTRYPGFPHKLVAKPSANVVILGVRADPPNKDEVVILDSNDGTVLCKFSSPNFSIGQENDAQIAIARDNYAVGFVNIRDCGEARAIPLPFGDGVFRFFTTSTLLMAGAGHQVVLVPSSKSRNLTLISGELPKPYVVLDIIGGSTPNNTYVTAFDESTDRYAILLGAP